MSMLEQRSVPETRNPKSVEDPESSSDSGKPGITKPGIKKTTYLN